MDEVEKIIWIEGLKNAVKFKGKANNKAVLGKLMKEREDLRSKANDVKNLVEGIVNQINNMDLDKQTKTVLELDAHALDPEEKKGPEEKILPDLPGANMGQVIMRLAPYPSGALHIGNARMIILNDEYVKRYKGKLLLVYDDTIGTTLGEINSPDAKFVIPESYELIREGLQWLGVKYHAEYYKSDRVDLYQTEAQKFIVENFAYVCTCEADKFRELYKQTGKECPCRNKPIEYHLDLYEQMKAGKIEEGKAVVRLKSGMDQKDPAIRDQVIMRISDAPHPRIGTKVRLWPTLEFSWGLDDHLLGITHIIRGADLRKEGDIEKIIWDMKRWPQPDIKLYGRLDFGDDFKLSKTYHRNMIQQGIFVGWNDPRTWSLQSLKIRGIRPEALREAILDLGISMRNITFDKAWVYAKNKHIIDPISERYWFVEKAHDLRVTEIPFEQFVAHPLRIPSDENKGHREIPITIKNQTSDFYIADIDLHEVISEGGKIIHPAVKIDDEIRMKDMFNIRILTMGKKIKAKFTSQEKSIDLRKVQVVPKAENIRVQILRPDGIVIEGYGEVNLKKLQPGTIVQFERYGFVSLQQVSDDKIFGYFIND